MKDINNIIYGNQTAPLIFRRISNIISHKNVIMTLLRISFPLLYPRRRQVVSLEFHPSSIYPLIEGFPIGISGTVSYHQGRLDSLEAEDVPV